MVGAILGAVWDFILRGGRVVLGWLAEVLARIFDAVMTVLRALFRPILAVIAILFYFLYKLAELFYLLFQVLVSVGKLVYAFVQGLIRTLAGLVWTPTEPAHGSWTPAIRGVMDGLALYQLDKLAYVMAFIVWITTAVGAVRILARGGGGGGV